MVARVHGFFETSYRIPRTLKETARISVPTFLYEPSLKGCLYRNRQEFNPFETFDRARIDFDGLLILLLSLFFLSFHATNPLLISVSDYRFPWCCIDFKFLVNPSYVLFYFSSVTWKSSNEIQITNSNGIRSQKTRA